jgi:hypothetical protein
VVGSGQGDAAEATDAIGLAEDGADALVEGQRLLEALPGAEAAAELCTGFALTLPAWKGYRRPPAGENRRC